MIKKKKKKSSARWVYSLAQAWSHDLISFKTNSQWFWPMPKSKEISVPWIQQWVVYCSVNPEFNSRPILVPSGKKNVNTTK